MSKYIGTVIKSGNSYAVRVPRSYIDAKQLSIGQKIRLADSPTLGKGNVASAMQKLQYLADKQGSLASINDPVAWQRQIRKETNEWERVLNDTRR